MITGGKEELINLFNTIIANLTKSEWHAFHLYSINNFIQYYDMLSVTDKENVYAMIYSYLNIIHKDNNSTESSYELFYNYVYPIGMYYEKSLNFGVKVGLWIILSLFMIIGGILFFIGNIILTVIVIGLMILYYSFLKRTDKKGMVFGYKY